VVWPHPGKPANRQSDTPACPPDAVYNFRMIAHRSKIQHLGFEISPAESGADDLCHASGGACRRAEYNENFNIHKFYSASLQLTEIPAGLDLIMVVLKLGRLCT